MQELLMQHERELGGVQQSISVLMNRMDELFGAVEQINRSLSRLSVELERQQSLSAGRIEQVEEDMYRCSEECKGGISRSLSAVDARTAHLGWLNSALGSMGTTLARLLIAALIAAAFMAVDSMPKLFSLFQ